MDPVGRARRPLRPARVRSPAWNRTRFRAARRSVVSLIAHPACQIASPCGRRCSTTASSRPARPSASPDVRIGGSVRQACRCGLESQQPTWPQVKHIRRCAHVLSPCSVHSWHLPGVSGSADDDLGLEVLARIGDRRERASRKRDLLSMLTKDTDGDTGGLATWVPHCWRFWWCRFCWPRWHGASDVSAPLALVVAGLAIGLIPGLQGNRARPGAGAVRAAAAAVVVGWAGEQLRRPSPQRAPDRAAGGRVCPWRRRSRSASWRTRQCRN